MPPIDPAAAAPLSPRSRRLSTPTAVSIRLAFDKVFVNRKVPRPPADRGWHQKNGPRGFPRRAVPSPRLKGDQRISLRVISANVDGAGLNDAALAGNAGAGIDHRGRGHRGGRRLMDVAVRNAAATSVAADVTPGVAAALAVQVAEQPREQSAVPLGGTAAVTGDGFAATGRGGVAGVASDLAATGRLGAAARGGPTRVAGHFTATAGVARRRASDIAAARSATTSPHAQHAVQQVKTKALATNGAGQHHGQSK